MQIVQIMKFCRTLVTRPTNSSQHFISADTVLVSLAIGGYDSTLYS